MVKRHNRKAVDRSRYREYHRVAGHFYDAAEASMELEYWTAAGVLIVHSAIAFADSLCIKLSGQKSTGDNHEDAIALLDQVVAGGEDKSRAINNLGRIIEEKTRVSYLGDLYTPADTKALWKQLQRFRAWATEILER